MYVLGNQTLQPTPIPGIEHVTLAGSEDGLRNLSLWKQSIGPGGATPPHRHDCEEVVLVERGAGELHIEGHVHAFAANSTLVIPRNVVHQIINTAQEPLEIVGVFAVAPVPVFLPDGQQLALPWRS